MGKYLNLTDMLLILFAAYLFVWGGNMILRNLGMGEYQA